MTKITDFLSDIPKDFTPEMRAAAVEVVAQRALYLLDLALAQHDADYGKRDPTLGPTHWTHGARKIFSGVERFSPEERAED